MSKYFLCIDLGSTFCKSALVDKEGKIVKYHKERLSTIYLNNNWVEHNPEEMWEKQYKSLLKVLEGIDPKDIISMGIANQRETIVAWDRRTGVPVYNAISWQDRRNSDFLEIYKEYKKFIKDNTELILDLYFSAPKIDWILRNCKYDWNYLCVGTVDSWLLWKLTNKYVFATDVSNASRTMLFDIERCVWSDYMMVLFKFPIHIFPQVLSSASFFGYWEYKGHKIPINGVIGDQQSSLLGCGGINGGDTKCTYGTGAFLISNIGFRKLKNENLLKTIAWRIGNKEIVYGAEGSCFSCGNVLDWGIKNKYFKEFYDLKSSEFEPVFFCHP